MNVAKQQTAVCLVGWTFNQKLKLAGNLSVAMFFHFFQRYSFSTNGQAVKFEGSDQISIGLGIGR